MKSVLQTFGVALFPIVLIACDAKVPAKTVPAKISLQNNEVSIGNLTVRFPLQKPDTRDPFTWELWVSGSSKGEIGSGSYEYRYNGNEKGVFSVTDEKTGTTYEFQLLDQGARILYADKSYPVAGATRTLVINPDGSATIVQ